jgi:hypothetical protein
MFLALMPLTLLAGMSAGPTREMGEIPRPSPTPIAWEMEFAFLDPQRIEVLVPGADEPEIYWYIVYTVTNTSPRTQRFFPTFQIVTEDLVVQDTDVGISMLVFDAIKARHAVTHPYLVTPTEAIGPLKTGADNARESVAIWRQIDLSDNDFTVYVAGLSGEARAVPNPAYDPERPELTTVTGPDGRQRELVTNPKTFTLRKTLEIRYAIPGSPAARPQAVPERLRVRWILR